MTFFLFIVVNAILFVRPAEIVPALIGLPIYNGAITICLCGALVPVVRQLQPRALAEQPITACVIGILGTVILSHVCNFDLWSAQFQGTEFLKVTIYYLLLNAVLDTPSKFRAFLFWLVLFTSALAGLALLQYHGYVNIPALEALERIEIDDETGEPYVILQLCSTGMYNDPNDLCLILVVGAIISLYRLTDRTASIFRVVWIAPIVLFVYSVILTSSRGGFLALLSALLALFITRFGWRKSVPLAMVAVPAIFLLSGGRQTRISTGEDTAQERMKLWSEGLHMVSHSPKWAVAGIGAGNYADEMGQVAHNSFVHAYVEMGFLGGTLFLGAFYLAVRTLSILGKCPSGTMVPELQGLRPFLVALLIGYSAGMFSLSRCYIVPTYMVLGLTTAYINVALAQRPNSLPQMNGRTVKRLVVLSVAFLVFIQIFIRVSIRWG